MLTHEDQNQDCLWTTDQENQGEMVPRNIRELKQRDGKDTKTTDVRAKTRYWSVIFAHKFNGNSCIVILIKLFGKIINRNVVIPVKQPAIQLNELNMSNSTGIIYKFSGHESEKAQVSCWCEAGQWTPHCLVRLFKSVVNFNFSEKLRVPLCRCQVKLVPFMSSGKSDSSLYYCSKEEWYFWSPFDLAVRIRSAENYQIYIGTECKYTLHLKKIAGQVVYTSYC